MVTVDLDGEIRKVIDTTIKEVGFNDFTGIVTRRIIERVYDIICEVEASREKGQEQTEEVEDIQHVALPRNIQNFVASQERRLAKGK